MSSHALTKENLLAAFPQALQGDASVLALAEAAAELLTARLGEIDRLTIYPAIDRLEEPLLDILAHDYKVDWWDPNYSLSEKRRTLKDSWKVHKLLGTKAAVETAISAIYPETTVEEWFEYGGEPYHFRLHINITNGADAPEKRRQVLSRLNFYKPLRAHSDGVTYQMEPLPAWVSAGGAVLGSCRREQIPRIVLAAAPPKGEARTLAGAGYCGQCLRMESRVSLPETVRPLHKEEQVLTGAKAMGQRLRMTARTTVPESVQPPRVSGSASAGAALAGIYQQIKKEVPIHGTLDGMRSDQ